jgi:hypothetical protein
MDIPNPFIVSIILLFLIAAAVRMSSRTAIKHILMSGFSAVVAYVTMLGSFMLAMSTFHNGPASDYSFSRSHIYAADVGYTVWQVLLWPGQHLPWTSTSRAYFVSSALYGILTYGLLTAFRRKKSTAEQIVDDNPS